MRIIITCPASSGSRTGNRTTALRWKGILRELGHDVRILPGYDGRETDLLVALHARKSAPAVRAFRRRFPSRPVIVALTGTDVYRDLSSSTAAWRSLEWADRIVTLQPLAARELPKRLRNRVRVIFQSAVAPRRPPASARHRFEVSVIGHLRPVKDPFRPALAARRLPKSSRVEILHMGTAMSPAMERRARAEQDRNPRYRWLGPRSPSEARRRLARSRLMVLPSRMEGGANVLSEACVAGVPILASRIPGSVGLLGEDYPGFFPVADTGALARLLGRAEAEPAFLEELRRGVRRRASLFLRSREKQAWRRLVRELRRQPGFRAETAWTSSPRRRRRRSTVRPRSRSSRARG